MMYMAIFVAVELYNNQAEKKPVVLYIFQDSNGQQTWTK